MPHHHAMLHNKVTYGGRGLRAQPDEPKPSEPRVRTWLGEPASHQAYRKTDAYRKRTVFWNAPGTVHVTPASDEPS